jgi:hypothetical protein
MLNSRNIFLVVLIAVVMLTPGDGVFAFESSSASFEIHAGDTESITGTSTSASFGEQNAGGQTAVGSSTSATTFGDCSGILCWLMGWFTARYDQIHYRWRNDNGSETLATWAVTPEDTQYMNFQKNTAVRLRFEISNEGWTRGAAPSFQLEVAETTTCSSGTYAAVPTDYSGSWHLATTTNPTWFTDGDPTTNVASGLPDENGNFVPGKIKDTGNTTGAITLTSYDFTEVEFGVMALNAATVGGTYCFRLTNGGSATNFNYSQYPKAILASGLVSGTLTSSVFDTGVANGAAYNSITWIGALLGGKVRLKIATSNSPSGPWDYRGSSSGCALTDTGDSDWFVINTDTPTEIKCFSNHNNKRYYRYRIQLCAASDCVSSGSGTPRVDDVIISWAP